MTYNKYIISKEWMRFSNKVKSIYPLCVCCGKRGILITHHINYKRIGRENLDDIVVLCNECHGELHLYLKLYELKTLDSLECLGKIGDEGTFKRISDFYSENNYRKFSRIRKDKKKSKRQNPSLERQLNRYKIKRKKSWGGKELELRKRIYKELR